MPRKGYISVMGTSLPKEFVEAIDRLMKDPKYLAEMKTKGHFKVSRALVFRNALQDYLKSKGLDIACISATEDK